MISSASTTTAGRRFCDGINRIARRNQWYSPARCSLSVTGRRFSEKAKEETADKSSKESKITWSRGYLGAHSNTEPPDVIFLGVTIVVIGAGFYAWFVDPPRKSE